MMDLVTLDRDRRWRRLYVRSARNGGTTQVAGLRDAYLMNSKIGRQGLP